MVLSMVLKILEYNYKGFHLVSGGDDKGGWLCVIGEQEIRFPHGQAAEAAIDEILKGAENAIVRNKGVVLRKVAKSSVTNAVECEKPY